LSWLTDGVVPALGAHDVLPGHRRRVGAASMPVSAHQQRDRDGYDDGQRGRNGGDPATVATAVAGRPVVGRQL